MNDREEFEAWAKDQGLSLTRYEEGTSRHGEYFMFVTHGAWMGWQAARRWRSIEEAPKDGSRVLVYVPPYGAMTGNNSFALFGGQMEDFWHCHACLNKDSQPTHFQPLPPPPTGDES